MLPGGFPPAHEVASCDYYAARNAWKQAGIVVDGAPDKDAPATGKAVTASSPLNHALKQPQAARTSAERAKKNRPRPLLDVVTDLAFSSKEWYAATPGGLLVSADQGATWRRKLVGPLSSLPVQSVRVSSSGRRIRVVSMRGLVFTEDGGNAWVWHDLPLNSGGAVKLDVQPGDENTLVATARNGLYISRDAGKTWQQPASGLPSTPVQGFAATGGVFVASMEHP